MAGDLARLLARPIAHRGLHGCGRGGPVENSLGAARAAIAAGFGIECDVRLSRDGEVMVFHDADLERLTGVPGLLAARDAASLRALPLVGGEPDHVPRLADLLAALAGRVPLVIEMKAQAGGTALADRVLASIDGYGGSVALESFDPALVRHCRSRNTSRPIGLVGPAEDGASTDPAVVSACDFLSWSIAHLDDIAAAHSDKPLTTWTVRTPEQARKALALRAQIVFESMTPSRPLKADDGISIDL